MFNLFRNCFMESLRMSFKNYRELFQALLDGKKITGKNWYEDYFYLNGDLGFLDSKDQVIGPAFNATPVSYWSLYQEPTPPCSHEAEILWASRDDFKLKCKHCKQELIPTNGWTVAK